MLTGEWIADLFSFGGETTLPETKRLERLEKKMLNKLSFGQVACMRSSLKHQSTTPFALRTTSPCTPDTPDILIDALDDGARARASKAAEKKKKDKKPPKRNDRGGETATMPIWRGYKLWQNKAGLNIKADLDAVI